jgi:hypothetical protein
MNIAEKIEANFAPPSCLDGMRFDLSKKMWNEIKEFYIEKGREVERRELLNDELLYAAIKKHYNSHSSGDFDKLTEHEKTYQVSRVSEIISNAIMEKKR